MRSLTCAWLVLAACVSREAAPTAGTDLERFLGPLKLSNPAAQDVNPEARGEAFVADAPDAASAEARRALVAWLGEEWGTETIHLPPSFAPELPAGVESLHFAPGMFEPEADDFWTYTFMLELEGPAPDQAQLQGWLELYYDGLLTSVAASAGRDIGADPATATVQRTGARSFELEVDFIDAFVTFDAFTLHGEAHVISADPAQCALIFLLSPAFEDPAIARSLELSAAAHADQFRRDRLHATSLND